MTVEGYKPLSTKSITLCLENRALEEQVLRRIDEHVFLINGGAEIDPRAVALARTHIEEAFMWLEKALNQTPRKPVTEKPA